ncbi:uncharacterized protein TRUGW13939_07617 [Talaromyces rugulosus]|uniref:Uncharacterized protein n=1 Tax=Talaromyces rugulosus TaxID=121627 RepID=A0A7H8R2B0_TALRU|nr:uncharacterized protein TRUGW13939_07617 [Talaromyces rugulosus]QKX60472.1 hypothetical protein TRUGW13939_07617 [Talaromyces rugulosus]
MSKLGKNSFKTFFRECAKIKLSSLSYNQFNPFSRQLDPWNVSRLVKDFQDYGCFPLDPENRVSALISENIFKEALRLSNLATLCELQELPWLKLPEGAKVELLTGHHRIVAASKIVEAEEDPAGDSSEKWWVVNLYSEGMATVPSWGTSNQ